MGENRTDRERKQQIHSNSNKNNRLVLFLVNKTSIGSKSSSYVQSHSVVHFIRLKLTEMLIN